MESVYKIKIRTDPDLRGLYPSERRYSASNVLGLGVIHIAFAALALIFASLNIFTEHPIKEIDMINQNGLKKINQVDLKDNEELKEEDVNTVVFNETNETNTSYENNTFKRTKREVLRTFETTSYTYLSLACFVMSVGALFAGLTGLLAWKRWYIDNNIQWFFLTSCFSIISSSLSIISTIITISLITETANEVARGLNVNPHLKIGLSIHILIASIVEFMLSALSVKIAYTGMNNSYPEDIIIPKSRGKIEVNTIRKGNKKGKIMSPDILNHFHMTGKFAKYFPRGESNYLPNAESNSEYQERVRKFLSSNIETSSVK